MVSKEADEPRSHARMLVPLIDDLLRESGQQPEGICVDEGPGSYTGLRIGVSTAKGLAWSLGIPLYAVPSLALMAAGAAEAGHAAEGTTMHVATGARGTELFTATYRLQDGHIVQVAPPSVQESAEFCGGIKEGVIVPGSDPVRQLLDSDGPAETDTSGPGHLDLLPVIAPHSRFAHTLLRNPAAAYRVEDVSSFEPRYLRAFVARKPAKSIFDRLPF